MKVHINDIYIPSKEEGNFRIRKIDEPKVLETAHSLQQKGLLNIPTVTKGNNKLHDKPYEVGDGNGRLAAFLLILLVAEGEKKPIELDKGQIINGTYDGKKFDGKIEVVYSNKVVTPQERISNQITANYNVKASTNSEYIDALVTIRFSHPEWSDTNLADFIGITVTHLQRLFKTLKLPDSLREKLSTKELTLVNAVVLSKMVNKCDEETFAEYSKDALELNNKEFAPKVDSYLQNKRSTDAEERRHQGFLPKPKILNNTNILDILQVNLEAYEEMKKNKKTSAEQLAEFKGRTEILKMICSLDDKSVAAQKAVYDKKIADQKTRQEQSKETREKEKLLENMYAMVEAGSLKEKDITGSLKKDYLNFKEKIENK